MKGDYSRLALFCAACFCLLCRPAAAQVLITENEGGFTFELREGRFGGDQFGFEIAPIADLDGNGIRELVVASRSAGGGSSDLYILFLNRDGTVLRNTKIVDPLGGAVSAIDVLGDVDGDGVQEILLAGFDALFQASLNREGTLLRVKEIFVPPRLIWGMTNLESQTPDYPAIALGTRRGDIGFLFPDEGQFQPLWVDLRDLAPFRIRDYDEAWGVSMAVLDDVRATDTRIWLSEHQA